MEKITSRPIAERFFWPLLLALFACYWGMRLVTLFTAIETVSWDEDLSLGAIAKELLSGLKTSYWHFQLASYSGESLVLAPIAAVLFKLFGANLVVLKLLPVICYFLIIALMAGFMTRHFSRQAALWSSFFLVFLPPVIAAHTLVPLCGHVETVLLDLLTVFCFYEFLFGPEGRNKKISFICFSILAGFNFWVFYGSAVVFASCLAVWLAVSPKTVFSKRALFLPVGFLIGFSPWIYGYLTQEKSSADMLQTLLFLPLAELGERLLSFPRRLVKLLFFSFPIPLRIFRSESWLSTAQTYAHYFIFLFSAAGSAVYCVRNFSQVHARKLLFFLVYPIILVAFFCITDLDVPMEYSYLTIFRYFTPLFILSACLLGYGAPRLRRWLLMLVVLFSVLGQKPLFFREPFGQGLHIKPYSYYFLGSVWNRFFIDRPFEKSLNKISGFVSAEDSKFAVLGAVNEYWEPFPFWWSEPHEKIPLYEDFERLPPLYRAMIAEKTGSFIYSNYRIEGLKGLIAKAESLSPELKPYYYRGILVDFYGYGAGEFLENPAVRELVPAEHRHWAFFGVGAFFLANPLAKEDVWRLHDFVKGLNAEELKWYYRGMGARVFNNARPRLFLKTRFEMLCGEIPMDLPEEFKPDFYWGLAWQLSRIYPEDPARVLQWIEVIPGPYQAAAKKGAEAAALWDSGKTSGDFLL